MEKKDVLYVYVVSVNVQNVGGAMGSEHTFDNWRLLFSSVEKAKHHAELDYKKACGGKQEEIIKWKRASRNTISSQDLRWVMYEIHQMRVR